MSGSGQIPFDHPIPEDGTAPESARQGELSTGRVLVQLIDENPDATTRNVGTDPIPEALVRPIRELAIGDPEFESARQRELSTEKDPGQPKNGNPDATTRNAGTDPIPDALIPPIRELAIGDPEFESSRQREFPTGIDAVQRMNGDPDASALNATTDPIPYALTPPIRELAIRDPEFESERQREVSIGRNTVQGRNRNPASITRNARTDPIRPGLLRPVRELAVGNRDPERIVAETRRRRRRRAARLLRLAVIPSRENIGLDFQCPVCEMTTFESEGQLKLLRCGHKFHQRCIDRKLSRRPKLCPVCHQPYRKLPNRPNRP